VQAIWDAIRQGMGDILAFFYAIVPNAGFAIIMLTVLVRLILFPLTAKQAKSMIAMQRAQPEIKKLQAKYKNDRQKLNEEMMKFYKEHQINPLGGCLPLLAQTPVFIALYQTLREIQHFIPSGSAMYDSICGAGVKESACTKPVLDFFGMNLAQSASNGRHEAIGLTLCSW
jgi:YidC/Oxa1 family membrane protein insertase